MPPVGRVTIVKLFGGELHQYLPIARLEQQRQRLLGVKRRALDLSEPFRRFLPRLYRDEVRIFAAEGLPIPWPRLSPLYAAWKEQRYPGKTILRRTDRLYISLTQPGGLNIAEAHPRSIRFGTRDPKWRWHQLGTRRMPARPPVVLLPASFAELARDTMEHVWKRGEA